MISQYFLKLMCDFLLFFLLFVISYYFLMQCVIYYYFLCNMCKIIIILCNLLSNFCLDNPLCKLLLCNHVISYNRQYVMWLSHFLTLDMICKLFLMVTIFS